MVLSMIARRAEEGPLRPGADPKLATVRRARAWSEGPILVDVDTGGRRYRCQAERALGHWVARCELWWTSVS